MANKLKEVKAILKKKIFHLNTKRVCFCITSLEKLKGRKWIWISLRNFSLKKEQTSGMKSAFLGNVCHLVAPIASRINSLFLAKTSSWPFQSFSPKWGRPKSTIISWGNWKFSQGIETLLKGFQQSTISKAKNTCVCNCVILKTALRIGDLRQDLA